MRDIAEYRGPDGAGLWRQGPVGLAHRLLRSAEESLGERQPLSNGKGLWVVADCRIDNREELREEFQSRGVWRDPSPPDVSYILLAYGVWGRETPHHLLGDFSFALWEERTRTLFCARDPLGVKPFVYHWDGRKFLFGSDMKQILQDPSVSWELDLSHLAEFLAMVPDREGTPYRAVRRLPPGHSLTVRKDRVDVERYWKWDPASERLSDRPLEENEEIFRSLFRDAVRARMRVPSPYRAGALLSGGLDSSSIASMASTLLEDSRQGGEGRFPVFSLRYPEADHSPYQLPGYETTNEASYAEAVIQKHRLEAHPIEVQGRSPFENRGENLWCQEVPLYYPTTAYFIDLYRRSEESGVRAILHGEGGDELFLVGGYCFPYELMRGNGSKFVREWRARRLRGHSAGSLFRLCGMAFLPPWLKRAYRRLIGDTAPDWIDPALQRKLALRERMNGSFYRDPRFYASPCYGILSWIVWEGTSAYLESANRAGAQGGVEVRFPFLDLRLFRFMATIPWDQKASGGRTKLLLRRALKDLLPAEVANRFRKTEFSPVCRGMVESHAADVVREVLEAPHPALRALLVPSQVRALYERYFCAAWPPRSDKIMQSFYFFWDLMGTDQWLKNQPDFQERARRTHEIQASPQPSAETNRKPAGQEICVTAPQEVRKPQGSDGLGRSHGG